MTMKKFLIMLVMIWLTEAYPQKNIVNFPDEPTGCYTTGGPDSGKECVFPFIHGAIEYHDCTRAGHKDGQLWCSTKVDSNGRHLAGQNSFGTCAKLCFSNSKVWSNWGSWGACGAFCGGGFEGVQERTRSCDGTNCEGNEKETKSCFNLNKCSIGAPCKVGTFWKQDCNTCICTKEATTMCTSNSCPAAPPPTPAPCTSDRDGTAPHCEVTPPPTPAPIPNPCTNDGDEADPQCEVTRAPIPDPCTSDRDGPDPQCTVPAPDPCTTDPDVPLPQCTDSNICMTDSGPTSNQRCVFPFMWGGITFNDCDVWRWGGKDEGKFWCSTKTDENGIHINGQGNYGFCPKTEACRGLDLTPHGRISDSEGPELQIAPH